MKRLLVTSLLGLLCSIAGFSQNDTTTYDYQTVVNKDIKYRVYTTTFGTFIIKGKRDTVLNLDRQYFTVKFQDFNNDGYKDIFFDLGGNTPERYDLFIFNPNSGRFTEIKNFNDFPSPIRIKGTRYYYSYHKSGCADMNWDSDLFYIKSNRTFRIGNIAGRQCEGNGVKDAVYIYKVRGKKEKLFKTLPIATIWEYKDLKWGFIQEYWKKNYRLFTTD